MPYDFPRPAAKLPVRTRPFLVADLFCGAGGSSTGARMALEDRGIKMNLVAVNHWPLALETHSRNHPQARHVCADLETARPLEIVPEGRLDLLMASPSCVYHSRARGGKPVHDQQRMDPWAIVRWCTELRVARVIVENVPEFRFWGPCDPRTGRPVKSRRGEYFQAWLRALEAIGFSVDWRILNCADYGDATTRQRFFLIARSDGNKPAWPQPSHSRRSETTLLGLEPWRTGRECIDWDRRGTSIFNRKRPLAHNTLARIYAGAIKFGWDEPYLVILRNHMDGASLDQPFPTIMARGTHIGLAEPILVNLKKGAKPGSVNDPFSTLVTRSHLAVAESVALDPFDPPPFILSQHSGGAPRSIDDPVPGLSCGGAHALIAPYYGSGSGKTCVSIDDPLPTATAKARFAMVMPVTHCDGSDRARSLDDPIPTITGAHRGELAYVEAAEECGGRSYDILFRMLHWTELAAAMSLDDYDFAGNCTEITKQIGNAVPARTARALVDAMAAA